MPVLSKSVAALASAALLASGSIAVATSAEARPAHASHAAAKHQKPHAKVHDKLAGPRKAAGQAVSAQLKAVQLLVNRAGTLTTGHATQLQGALAADLAAVKADLAGVSGATSVKALNSIKAAANTTRQVARTQYTDVVAADAAAAQVSTLSDTLASLQDQLAALLAAGTDTSAGQAVLDQAGPALADLSAQLEQLVAGVLALSPNAARSDLHSVAEAAETALQAIADALAGITSNLTDVQTQYGL